METKQKIIKTARICGIVAKILYIITCVLCLTFIILAIVLPSKAVETLSAAETAVLFGTLALYAFIGIGLLWNVEGIFKSITEERSPFGEKANHYIKKTAIYLVIISVIPAIAGSTVLRAVCPSTELVFPVEAGGLTGGIVLFLTALFFRYGTELQKSEDETL